MSSSSGRIFTRENPLLRLVPYLKRYRGRLLLGALTVLLTNLAAVGAPWVLREATNALQAQGISPGLIGYYALLIVILALLEGIFRYLMRKILIGTSRFIEFDLRNDLFRHLQVLSGPFYQRHPTGDLMARSTNDLAAVRSVLGPGIMYSINTLFTSVLTISILVSISPRLALLVLLPLVAVSLSVKYFGKRIHQRFQYIQEQFSWITTLAQENVSGIRVVQAYNQEEAFIERFRKANNEYIARNMSLVRIWGAFQPLLTLLLGLSLVFLLWYGGRQVVQGAITLGDFVAFIAYLSMLTWPTIALGFVINIFERGSASMARLNQIFDASPEVHDRTALEIDSVQGDLRVNELSFSYNGQKILKNISFRVEAGKTLAIVGRTGSGKSTLLNLLCRLYPVPESKIFVDGIDVNRIPLATLRQAIGYAPQEALLFSDTIRGNIAFGSPTASQEKVEHAAEVSNIHQDIEEFPEGYETFVGERGITLSGGQKQRVSISRALIVDPRILILDDSLSAVDTQTEERILQQLHSELSGRTAVLVSHRISTVKMADQIIVLDAGAIVERGNHEQLLARDGYYAELYRQQLLKEELELEE